MAEILHQLIGSLSHCLQVLYIPGGAGFPPSTVWFKLSFVLLSCELMTFAFLLRWSLLQLSKNQPKVKAYTFTHPGASNTKHLVNANLFFKGDYHYNGFFSHVKGSWYSVDSDLLRREPLFIFCFCFFDNLYIDLSSEIWNVDAKTEGCHIHSMENIRQFGLSISMWLLPGCMTDHFAIVCNL